MPDSIDNAPVFTAQPQADISQIVRPVQNMLMLKATTALAGAMLGLFPSGVITSDQAAQTAGTIVAIGMFGLSILWSHIHDKANARQVVAAAATGNPAADPKAPATQIAVTAAINDPASPITAKLPGG